MPSPPSASSSTASAPLPDFTSSGPATPRAPSPVRPDVRMANRSLTGRSPHVPLQSGRAVTRPDLAQGRQVPYSPTEPHEVVSGPKRVPVPHAIVGAVLMSPRASVVRVARIHHQPRARASQGSDVSLPRPATRIGMAAPWHDSVRVGTGSSRPLSPVFAAPGLGEQHGTHLATRICVSFASRRTGLAE